MLTVRCITFWFQKLKKKKKRNGVSEFRKCRNRKNLDTEINTGHVL